MHYSCDIVGANLAFAQNSGQSQGLPLPITTMESLPDNYKSFF